MSERSASAAVESWAILGNDGGQPLTQWLIFASAGKRQGREGGNGRAAALTQTECRPSRSNVRLLWEFVAHCPFSPRLSNLITRVSWSINETVTGKELINYTEALVGRMEAGEFVGCTYCSVNMRPLNSRRSQSLSEIQLLAHRSK